MFFVWLVDEKSYKSSGAPLALHRRKLQIRLHASSPARLPGNSHGEYQFLQKCTCLPIEKVAGF
ncbi:hypothetical protein PAE9249_04769 [Paenibacillus sp. CECT 9249]|nr:hypothetical protein PAE9249_04769 [Paenibacillus sp. CECT 9249]